MLSITASGMDLPEPRTIDFKKVGKDSFLFRLRAIPSLRQAYQMTMFWSRWLVI